MVEEKFLVDTNSLITPYRLYYAFDLVPSYWDRLSENIGKIVLLDMVKSEIDKGNDDLTVWVNSLKGFEICYHLSQEIVDKWQEVIQYVQTCGLYNENALHSWAQINVADPWLIAAAAVYGYTIITLEGSAGRLSPMNKSGKVKIPDVARAFGVKTNNIFYMMRQLGIKI